MVEGIDISKYDGEWDADKARMSGCEFAFIKSSQSNYSDPMFQSNRTRAKAAGMLRGFYHYLDWLNIATVTGAMQADYMLSLIGNDPPELPVVVDCEYQKIRNNSGVEELVPLPSNAIYHIQNFVTKIEKAGLRVEIYTGVGFWNEPHGDPFWKDQFWKHVGLWVANWDVIAPRIPSPWDSLPAGQQWVFWQWRCSRNIMDCLKYGTSGKEIDLNRWAGTLEELQKFGNMVPPVVVPPHPSICPTCGRAWPTNDPVPPTDLKYKVKAGINANVHTLPSANSPVIRVALAGSIVYLKSTTLSGTYAQLTDGTWITFSYLQKVA